MWVEKLKNLIEEGVKEREEGLEREKKGLPIGKLDNSTKEKINKLSDFEKAVLLAMTMESLRGYWGEPETRLGIVAYLCDTISNALPKQLLKAIKHNAYLFSGHLIDGRIFRDGDREFGLSGNLAFQLVGDDRVTQKGFYGTYAEVWNILGGIEKNEKTIRKLYLEILSQTSDLTWENVIDAEGGD